MNRLVAFIKRFYRYSMTQYGEHQLCWDEKKAFRWRWNGFRYFRHDTLLSIGDDYSSVSTLLAALSKNQSLWKNDVYHFQSIHTSDRPWLPIINQPWLTIVKY